MNKKLNQLASNETSRNSEDKNTTLFYPWVANNTNIFYKEQMTLLNTGLQ
jgi:hypothetical protein